jgi:hypothetical protein
MPFALGLIYLIEIKSEQRLEKNNKASRRFMDERPVT